MELVKLFPASDRKLIAFCIILSFTVQFISAQHKIPFIRATSKVVDIRDGDDYQKGIWHISPEVNPDIFYVERFKGHKRVTFYTDIDSISFIVEPGKLYKFIILLDDKDTAYTQVSSVSPPKLNYIKDCNGCITSADTIPFTLGWNNNIKLKGKINNSDMLNLIFDTGANGVVLSSDAFSKNVKIKVNGSIQGYGFGGASEDQISKLNNLQISVLKWINISLTVKHQGKPNADVVIGYNVFDGKVIEINYDKKVLVIHHALPKMAESYSKHVFKFKAGLSFIKAILDNGKKKSEGWFDFDTGSASTLFLNNEFATENGLYSTMKKEGEDKLKGGGPNKISIEEVLLPKLSLGRYELTKIPIGLETASSKDGPPFNIIGNDILKRFNIIIDYENDVVYLKPNSLANELYLSQKVNYLIWGGGTFFLGLLIIGFVVYRKTKAKRRKVKQQSTAV